MQREIKFKEYRGDGKWHFWGLMDEGKFVGPCSPNSKAFQYIGLKDKKGTDIFDGDIVRWIDDTPKERRGVVDYMEQGSRFIIRFDFGRKNYFKEFNADYGDDTGVYKTDIEVIGHSVETPSLVNRAVGFKF